MARRAGKVGIFSGNTVQWMLAMQAGNYYSMVVGERPRQKVLHLASPHGVAVVQGGGVCRASDCCVIVPRQA